MSEATAPFPAPEVERSSSLSSAETEVVCPPLVKESRELSWLMAELKKAGGSWGVGAGRTERSVRMEVVLLEAEKVPWRWKKHRESCLS